MTVVRFNHEGLVRQQLDSFDYFLDSGLQECVDDLGEISVTSEPQYLPGQQETKKKFTVKFEQASCQEALASFRSCSWPLPTTVTTSSNYVRWLNCCCSLSTSSCLMALGVHPKAHFC